MHDAKWFWITLNLKAKLIKGISIVLKFFSFSLDIFTLCGLSESGIKYKNEVVTCAECAASYLLFPWLYVLFYKAYKIVCYSICTFCLHNID